MTYRAHIKNGVAVLDEDVKLPEGAEVRIEPVTSTAQQGSPQAVLRFAGIWADSKDEVNHQLQELTRQKQLELCHAADLDDRL